MLSFRTEISIPAADFCIGHSDQVLLVGSCFTEHLGQRLLAGKIPATINPFGIVYNPEVIGRCLERLWAGDQFFTGAELFEHQGRWHSWQHHGQFSHPDRGRMLESLNEAYTAAAEALRKTDRLILTLGTADVFLLPETGQIVANNHKMPAATFQSRRLQVAEIVESLAGILQKIKTRQAGLEVILTVSPVRHLRAGAVENQRSKATLVLAAAELTARLPFVHYFPAYELVMDDLRDYRFYATDLVHPSEMAVDYIWQQFRGTFFSTETKQLITSIEQLHTAMRHRPFHPDTEQHRAFVRAQLAGIAALQAVYPKLDFLPESRHFQQFL